MKKILSIIIFIGFAILCGAEIIPKFIDSALKESGTVSYISGAESKIQEKAKTKVLTDYQCLVKDIDANGA